jgi:hypothetical protein
MIKAFVYPDHEIARAFGFTPEQLERARVRIAPEFEPTTDAGAADFFWCAFDLGHVEAYLGGVSAIKRGVERLSHWQGNEGRHIFYFCSDGAEPVGIPSIMFRQSFYKTRRDDWAIAWPYAVEDFSQLCAVDFDSLPYDVSFVGSRVSHRCRIESFDSVKNTPGIKSFLDDSGLHWGKIENTALGAKRRQIFVDSLANSRMVLAARGGGLSCYRFFEAMSAGRVPILLADDWELPHPDLIHWDWAIVQIPEKSATIAGLILRDFLSKTDSRKLQEMGAYARGVWQSYLAPEVWPEMMTWYIERLLR